jgi:hypothetical protein
MEVEALQPLVAVQRPFESERGRLDRRRSQFDPKGLRVPLASRHLCVKHAKQKRPLGDVPLTHIPGRLCWSPILR